MAAPPIVEKSSFSPTILVSGGAGFLGSHLVRHLLKEKARVVIVDNLLTGKKSAIADLLKKPRLLFIEHDINQGLPKNIKSVDYVLHLAGFETYTTGKTGVVLEALLTNSLGTKALLELAVKSEAKFLLASSLDIYQGVLSSFDLKNYFGSTDPEERRFSHLEAKRFAESLVWQYYKKHHLNARIARLPEIYGPGMNLNSCANLGRLLAELLQKETLTIFGEGLEREFYLHIDDAVRGMVKAMFTPETEGKIFSLTPPEGVTTLEL
ncbi:MAG: NAD-dependent epimerase/dehydratase family protein, partial [Syntrophaceae bacterium]|nr:NAD-dependent epimerase/dehydratase family protein [Syntrophaceae bacterium]